MERSFNLRKLAWLPVLLLALAPCLLAVLQLGRVHPDETYQFLEPAYCLVRHYNCRFLAWEWHLPEGGLRNWAVPGLLSWFLRWSDSMGIESPRGYRAVMELPLLALAVAALFAVLRYLRRRLPDELDAWRGLVLVGLYGPLLALSGRTLGESISAGFLLLAVEALDREEKPLWAGSLGGLYLGLAVVARYGSAICVLAALLWLVWRRQWLQLLACGLAGILVALALGYLDKYMWGAWFKSLIQYVSFNVLGKGAAQQFGESPFYFFIPWLLALVPPWAYLSGLASAREAPRPRVALGLWMAFVYVVALSFTAHKEERFLYPAMVLLTLVAAPSLIQLLPGPQSRWHLPAGVGALLLSVLPSYAFLHALRGDQFRAIVAATRDADARGLLVVNEGHWGAGGYFYIGKNIPWTNCDNANDMVFKQVMFNRLVNRATTYDDTALPELQAAGFKVMGTLGQAKWLAR